MLLLDTNILKFWSAAVPTSTGSSNAQHISVLLWNL